MISFYAWKMVSMMAVSTKIIFIVNQWQGSPLRWCTAIIYKCLLTINNTQQYRNKLVHSEDGKLQTDERNRLQNLIYQEFIIGRNDLLICDMFLFEEYDLEQLLTADLHAKKFQIARINAAQKAVDLPEETEQNEEPNMRQLTINLFEWTND